MKQLIGGFFELHPLAACSKPNSLWAHWQLNESNCLLLQNARSALFLLLNYKKPNKIWLPAYLCDAIVMAVKRAGIPYQFYPVEYCLEPKIGFLQPQLSPRDAVLVIDYFGKSPGLEFRQMAASMADILWIEDKSHSLAAGSDNWGDYIIYSPRKLLGVPDGGILQGKDIDPQAFSLTCHLPAISDFIPAWLRYEDIAETHNEIWHQANIEKERKQIVGNYPMSRFTKERLMQIAAQPLIEQRQRNYSILHKALAEFAFVNMISTKEVPFGFVIAHPRREDLWQHLIRNQIFAQKHWVDIASDPKDFRYEHELATQLLTLPCDHRYGEGEMKKIVAIVKEALCSIPI